MTDEWFFLPGLDQGGEDVCRLAPGEVPTQAGVVAYNTLGFQKRKVTKLGPSPWFGASDGLYVRRHVYTQCLLDGVVPMSVEPFFGDDNAATTCSGVTRKAFLVTTDRKSERTIFSANILKTVGFDVYVVLALPHPDRVFSNRMTMQYIYNLIACGPDDFAYVFENDINLLQPITLQDILNYEPYVDKFIYLGLCVYSCQGASNYPVPIDGRIEKQVCGFVRGLHAIGLSKAGARDLYKFSQACKERYMDVTVELFSIKHPALVARYDLESYIPGHRGVFYQDRNRFPSEI